MQVTEISWSEYVWNVTIGCPLPIPSEGCGRCYARRLHNMRHKAYLSGKKLPKQYAKPFEELQLFPERLEEPLHHKKPHKIFVCSMSDLFHPAVPFEFITRVFDVMCSWRWPNKKAEREGDDTELVDPGHTYQILTKRPERVEPWLNWVGEFWPGDTPFNIAMSVKGKFPENIHFGVSVETEKYLYRINALKDIPAIKKFVSLEPLLSDIYIVDYLKYLNGIIIGAESIGGHPGRECKLSWIENLVEQAKTTGVKVFVKQLHINGKLVKDINQFPKDLRLRETI